MPILRGPTTIDEVANLIEQVSRRFFEHIGLNRDSSTEIVPWTDWNYELLPVDMRQVRAGTDLSQTVAIVTRTSQLVQTVNLYDNENNLAFKTRIGNLTLYEDIAKGQTFHPAVCTFVFQTWAYDCKDGWFQSNKYIRYKPAFIEYRDAMIQEAQRNLNQQVSLAAFNMMRDLR